MADKCVICSDPLADCFQIEMTDYGPICEVCARYRPYLQGTLTEKPNDDDDLQNRASVVFTYRLAA